jgi:hypothetical protein
MTKESNPIRVAALVCVAITSGYLMYMGYKINLILSGPDWCSRALQAERISAQNFSGLQDCVSLLTIQLKSLATNSHILFGVIALCLLVLIVIVIAGGRLNFKVDKTGASGSMGKDEVDPIGAAADHVVEGAREAAAEVKDTTPPKDGSEAPGFGMGGKNPAGEKL